MFEGPFAEQNSREVELKEFVEPALMGQVLHFLYFRNGELLPYQFDAKLRPLLSFRDITRRDSQSQF